MVISVILVTFISLSFVGAAILLQMQIGEMKGYWYDRAQVAVYLCTELDTGGNCAAAEASQEQIDAVAAQMDSPSLAPYIQEYDFETHEQAFTNFQEQFSDSPLASFTTPEMLNESFRVNLVDPNQADILIDSLKGLAGVQDVQDQRGYLDQIFAVLNAASYAAIGLASLMLVAAVLLTDPVERVQQTPGARHYAPRGCVQPLHPDAVYSRGCLRGAHRFGAGGRCDRGHRALLCDRLPHHEPRADRDPCRNGRGAHRGTHPDSDGRRACRNLCGRSDQSLPQGLGQAKTPSVKLD
jgi:hypothetical protein